MGGSSQWMKSRLSPTLLLVAGPYDLPRLWHPRTRAYMAFSNASVAQESANYAHMIFYACDIPEDLTYDIERDVWIRFDGDIATLGMTDVAQTRCGKFAALSFREVGKKVAQGKALATIESAKWVGPFPAPFSCEIVATNEEAFARDILLANKEPYSTGWLVRVRPTNLEAESSHLVTGEAAAEKYKERIKELKINCLRCID